ncbi:hypothetical protein ACFLSE_10010 [Bacteroidota bacterium]
MKKSNYIILALLFFSLNGFTQTDSKLQTDNNSWFGDKSKTISIEINKNRKELYEHADFKFVGMTQDGLIAYINFPMTSIACETEEYFFIYDLTKNQIVWRKFACSVDWQDKENKTVSEIIEKLDYYNFEPVNLPEVHVIKTEIVESDSLISIYYFDSESKKILTIYKKGQNVYRVHEATGYFISPFDSKLKIFILPAESDIEEVFVYGLKE